MKQSESRFKGAGRKLDSDEYDEALINFIKEARENELAITSSELIFKAIELIPEFKDKSYDSLHHWFKRFREKYKYSLRKLTKISQTLPTNYLEEVRLFLYENIKDMINIDIEKNGNLVANVDETPLVLEPITSTTLEKIGSRTVKIHSFGKTKQRISCLLCIFANGIKGIPTLVFKGVKDGTLERRLNNHPDVIKGKVKIKCQVNSWIDADIFSNWLKTSWFRTDKNKTTSGTILFMDRASSHTTEEILSLFKQYNTSYRLIPPGLTSFCQPLDISINKPFKDLIKMKYRNFQIKYKNTRKPSPEDMITWVSEAWWSNDIDDKMIKYSFKKAGINLKLDGSEDNLFTWPKQPEMLLIEDTKKIKNELFNNEINFENDLNNSGNFCDSEDDDIMFDYDRYSIKTIRMEVFKNLSEKLESKMDIDDIELNAIEKDYNYYYSYGLIK